MKKGDKIFVYTSGKTKEIDTVRCHCEEQSDEAIPLSETERDCFVGLCPPRNDTVTLS